MEPKVVKFPRRYRGHPFVTLGMLLAFHGLPKRPLLLTYQPLELQLELPLGDL